MSDEAPTEDQPIEEVAPEATEAVEDGIEIPFNINDVPEDYRSHVEAYVKQTQGAFTKKTQGLAEQRKQYEAAQADAAFLQSLRSDPEVQQAVLRELAEAHGYDMDDVEDEFEDDQDGATEGANHDPRLDELLAERDAEKQSAEWESFVSGVESHCETELAALASEEGRDLSDSEKDMIVSYALSLPMDGQNRPPVKEAFAALRKLEAEWQTRWIESKRSPQVNSGTQGSEQFDALDKQSRLDRMAAIVEGASTS